MSFKLKKSHYFLTDIGTVYYISIPNFNALYISFTNILRATFDRCSPRCQNLSLQVLATPQDRPFDHFQEVLQEKVLMSSFLF